MTPPSGKLPKDSAQRKRKALSKKTRFEVFKRDKFTCQYCGAKAPDVVLHVDHINPVANGGDGAIMNLVTACVGCNSGKGARTLDDRSAVERQRAQIEELQDRRQQLEMMLEWRDQEQASRIDVVDSIGQRLSERGGFIPSESGKQNIRRWLKRFTVQEILAALDEAFDSYMKFDGDKPISSAWETAFAKIPAVANLRRQAKERPHVVKVAYVQAILRRRFQTPRASYFEALESLVVDHRVPEDRLEQIAVTATDWEDFCAQAYKFAPRLPKSFEDYWHGPEGPEQPLHPEEPVELVSDGYDDDGYDDDGCD